MKVSRHQLQPRFLSSRKATIIDFDMIIAYVVFISTIIALVSYVISLTAPFSTNIELLDKEKSTLTVRDLIRTEFNLEEFNNVCDINYVNLKWLRVIYEIKGFQMPYIDNEWINPNSTNGGIVFRRNNNELHVLSGSDSTNRNLIIKVMIPQGASVNNISLESNDYFLTNYDEFNNFVVTINSAVSDGDVDEVIIKPVNGTIAYSIIGINNSRIYIGNLKVQDSCGSVGIIGRRTSFTRYGLLSNNRTDYNIKLTGDIWWTN